MTIGNEKMSKVRLLVGKGNQNKDANLSFAKQIKAVADKMYPGLIKDIYMGKGAYNQDLAPRSVLLEFGTHTLPKERVLASTGPMSEVVYKALYGGVTGSAGASDASRAPASETVEGADQDNNGAGWAVWLVVALVAGLGLFRLPVHGRPRRHEQIRPQPERDDRRPVRQKAAPRVTLAAYTFSLSFFSQMCYNGIRQSFALFERRIATVFTPRFHNEQTDLLMDALLKLQTRRRPTAFWRTF